VSRLAQRARAGRLLDHLLSGGALFVAYAALIVFVAVADPKFFHGTNLKNLFVQNAALAIVTVGMAVVIIGRNYDLSVGGIAGLAGVLFAKLSNEHSVLLAGVVAVLVAVACGLVNGIVVARLNVNSFMATFATGLVFSGLALQYQGPRQITVSKPGFDRIGLANWGPVPEPIVLTVAAFVVGTIVLQRTRFGQNVYAVGSNRESARLVGLPVQRTLVATFAVSGFTAGLGGLVLASQLGLGSADSGRSLPIEAIAAVVVGGISVYGGEGQLWRAALGGLILATMNNVFIGLSWSTETQSVAEGVVILLALGANRLVGRTRRDRTGPTPAVPEPQPETVDA
jgi:ribose/xylose/arabinose/galactoside ABC-type transport system permease subunit